MKYRILLSCLLWGFVSIRSFGQEGPAFSLPQLWEQAFSNYPSVEAYQAQLRQAAIQQKLVRNQYLPQVLLQAQNNIGTNQTLGGAFFPQPGSYNIVGSGQGDPMDPSSSLFTSLTVDWEFLQFGKQKKSLEAAGILKQQAKNRLDVEHLAIQAELSRTYFQVLFHQQMQRWALENKERLQSLFSASKSMSEAGLSPGADSLLVKASLKETEALLEDWKGRREERDLLLAMWVNMPSEQLNIIEKPFLSTPTSEIPVFEEADPRSHPQLAFREEQVNYAGKLKELASVNVLPSLSLLGGVQLRGNNSSVGAPLVENWEESYKNPVGNYLIGLGLKWNMSSLFSFRLNKGRYQEETSQRQAEAEEAALNLRSQQQIAQRQLVQGKEQIKNAEEAYEAASEAFSLFENRYNNGLINITELLQIQDILQRTEKTRLEAYYQFWIQQVELAEAKADFSFLQNVFE